MLMVNGWWLMVNDNNMEELPGEGGSFFLHGAEGMEQRAESIEQGTWGRGRVEFGSGNAEFGIN